MRRTLLGVIVAITLTAAAVVLITARVVSPRVEPLEPPLPTPRVDSEDAFPWEGAITLVDDSGQRLTWTVERVDGEVHLLGERPNWRVEHRARPDGTPLLTVKQSGGLTTRVTWLPEGARVERTDATGKSSTVTIREPGLWDESTVAARLAGLSWVPGKQVRLRIADLDLADGRVYPMIAEYVRQERRDGLACARVHLAIDDFRRLVSPNFEFCFSSAAGAKLLQYDGEGFTFRAVSP